MTILLGLQNVQSLLFIMIHELESDILIQLMAILNTYEIWQLKQQKNMKQNYLRVFIVGLLDPHMRLLLKLLL